MTHRQMSAALCISVFTMACFVSGCKKEEGAEAQVPKTEDRTQVVAKLAAADAHDGTTDKVISECLMCGLRMKGSPDHTSTHEGVTLQFCKEDCKKRFDEDPVTPLLAVNVDEE
jgi:YHS domain-containing protein